MIRTIYNDYDITEDDIRDCYGLDDTDTITEDTYSDYTHNMYELLEDDLDCNFEQSQYYIAQATRSTHYPEYYKNGSIGYKMLTDLTHITDLAQDYNIIQYDTNKHHIIMTTIGHDNNYNIIIKPLNKRGTQYVDKHGIDNLSYDDWCTLFNKHTKQLKEL